MSKKSKQFSMFKGIRLGGQHLQPHTRDSLVNRAIIFEVVFFDQDPLSSKYPPNIARMGCASLVSLTLPFLGFYSYDKTHCFFRFFNICDHIIEYDKIWNLLSGDNVVVLGASVCVLNSGLAMTLLRTSHARGGQLY